MTARPSPRALCMAAASALMCCLAALALATVAAVAVPALSGHVVDLTASLTAEQKNTLETRLQDVEARKGSQIAVLIVPSTAPETIEQYALRVVEQWKLGRKKIDDGALLLIAKQDRTLRIEVGYGLEGALNDAVSKRIISETITPAFRQGNFYQGISDGVERMAQVIQGEELPAPRQAGGDEVGVQGLLPVVFVMVVIVGSILRALLGRLPGAIVTGGITALLAWALVSTITLALLAGGMALLMTLMGINIGSFLGGFGGGSGRGSGGGFSGGGGGFGGGGASGRW